MKKRIFFKIGLMVFLLLLITPTLQATTSISNEQLREPIAQINAIRKQFMSIAENGYFKHVKTESNKENSALAQLYLDQIPSIREDLEKYNTKDLDPFSKRKVSTLLATTLYLKDMGENLLDYLSADTLENQYNFFTIHLQINEFILKILTDVENAPY